ncbi:MAG: adenylate/guanylate cyclase domain-containing protein [Phyllobacterium sp.]|uniref:adenylate/guanylate cyclase domain-containing protein n=1 Tax=Phyllobacterium sp. TaxID=1871046 RepID=UPI0030F00D7B
MMGELLQHRRRRMIPASPRRLMTVARRVRDFGTERYPEASRRRLRQVNILNSVLIAAYFFFAAFYTLADLKLLAVAVLLNVPFFLVPPFLHRLSEIAAATYIGIHAAFAFLLFSLIVGSAAGIHFWLLAASGLIVFFGTQRIFAAASLVCFMLGMFLVIEYSVPRFIETAPVSPFLAATIKSVAVFGSTFISAGFVYLAMHMADQAETALESEYARSEALLGSIMPTKIAARLKRDPQATIAEKYDQVTLVFADIVNFTPRANLLAPEDLVAFLNRIFSAFDTLAEKHGLEKIKTIGDAYMVAGGLPEAQIRQVSTAADMALDMLAAVRILSLEMGEEISVRIGIHTGPAVAGVLGKRKLFYDVWGDTVNTAARMEAYGVPGRIQVTEDVYKLLVDTYAFETRGEIEVKGKGRMPVYFLLSAHLKEKPPSLS